MTVLEIAEDLGIPAEVGEVTIDALRNADEAFGASTAGGVFFVTSVDGAPLGDGRTGPLTKRVHDTYWAGQATTPRFTLAVADVPRFDGYAAHTSIGVHLPVAKRPTSRAGHPRLRAELRRDWARR